MVTIPQLFDFAAKQFSSNILFWEKKDAAYKGITYREISENVNFLAAGLLSLGIEKGDKVALLSEGRSEWLVAELATLYTGAVVVPITIKLTEPAELAFRLSHSGTRFLFVSENQKGKIDKIISSLPEIEKIIVIGNSDKHSKGEIVYKQLISQGKNEFDSFSRELTLRREAITHNSLASISYTSGTTSDPKGIMLSHRNYTANIEQANSLFKVPESYTTLLILPWDHAFAHTVGLYTMIKNGASIAIVEQGRSNLENLRNIPKNIKEINPSFLLSVPALARNFKKNIESAVANKGRGATSLFNRSISQANKYYGDTFQSASHGNLFLRLRVIFFDKFIFRKIRNQFGGKMKFFIGGGALLDLELQQFFYAIGIPMFQGYGLSEAAPVISSNTPENHKLGSSGKLVENLELRIVDEKGNNLSAGQTGEIVVKGENIMLGYWKNEKASNEVLRDGWLFTGDMGHIDEDGFLFVHGRFKSLLIGNDGEKFSPEGIEESLVDSSPFIDQCMLYNNQGPYTIALVSPNKIALKNALVKASIDPYGKEGVNEALFLIRGEIDQFYSGGKHESIFPQRWLPSAIGILHEPFSEENSMINSTLKLVRPKVAWHYQELIDFLYTPEGKKVDNNMNVAAIRRLLEIKIDPSREVDDEPETGEE
jgi:long-chain acyl-CoA synthetase